MYRTGYELSDAEIRERYSAIGDAIDLPTSFYDHVAHLITKRCPPGGRVLDIGCGNGLLLAHLSQLRPDLELYGSDASQTRVGKTLSSALERWGVVLASGDYLPFATGSFDALSMTEVLEHLKDPVGALREAARLLRPGGAVVVTVPNMSAFTPFWQLAERCPIGLVQQVFLPFEHPLRTVQPIDTAYTYAEVRGILDEAELAVDEMHGHAFFPYIIQSAQVALGAQRETSGGEAASAASPLFTLHAALESVLDRLLPARMGYRLSLACRPTRAS